MLLEALIRSGSVLLLLLFGLAVAHKGKVLVRAEASAEPLFAGMHLGPRLARLALVSAIGVETLIMAALVISPVVGFAGTAALLTIYLVPLRRLQPAQACNCFGEIINEGNARSAMVRNGVLISASAGAALGLGTGAVGSAPLSGAALGIALITAAALAAPPAVNWLLRAGATHQSSVR